MTRIEALKLVRYMNKMGDYPATDGRTMTHKACADLAMQRLRKGRRKAVKILALSNSMIRVLDNGGKTVEIPLQKHTSYKTSKNRIFMVELEEQFFVPDTISWRWYKEVNNERENG